MNDRAELSWEECMALFDQLPGMELARRAEVIEKLVRNPSPGIRERALRIGAAVLTDETLVEYMRREADAVLRNAGLEILKERGSSSFALAVELLRDEDPEMVLQAVLILDHLKDPRAVEPMRSVLHTHPDPNIVQAAIVAIGHLGDARTIPDLLPFLEDEPWLQMAAVQALGGLRSPAAVAPLAALLTDLGVGVFAAEALAQIGGARAYEVLAGHWLEYHEQLDPETSLGLLAHVLEGLTRAPQELEGLRASLAGCLRDPYRGVRLASARCLLSLGPGPEDGEALNILAANLDDASVLPSCLARRKDLVDLLLTKSGALRSWAFLLLARHPRASATESVAAALEDPEAPAALPAILQALPKVGGRRLAEPLLELYLRLTPEERGELAPALAEHRAALAAAIEERSELGALERTVLAAVLGETPERVAELVLGLAPDEQVAAVGQLTESADVARALPWGEWLEGDPARYGELAAEVAVGANLRDLLPALRSLLAASPTPAVIRALGELGDNEAIPALLELLARGSPVVRPLAVESLGRIGGPQAREALRELAAGDDPKLARLSYKSLAKCATEADDAFFRAAASHSDWYVRLAAAEVLGRFARSENLERLSELAADPVELVSKRALAALEA